MLLGGGFYFRKGIFINLVICYDLGIQIYEVKRDE